MRDFQCAACRIRTRPAGDGGECPGCGSPLEPVVALADIVGFRSVTTGGPIDNTAPVGDFTARRDAAYAQRVSDALAAEQWMDVGGFAVAAVALATPHTAGAPGEKGTT